MTFSRHYLSKKRTGDNLFFCWLIVIFFFPVKGFLLFLPDNIILVLGRGVDSVQFEIFGFGGVDDIEFRAGGNDPPYSTIAKNYQIG